MELSNLQKQVDNQITLRLESICGAEWRKVNILPNGQKRKRIKPVTYSSEVTRLLELRQELYNGVDPEKIWAEINFGEINDKYWKSREQ